MIPKYLQEAYDGYVQAAIWSSNDWNNMIDGNPQPLDQLDADLSDNTAAEMLSDVARFITENYDDCQFVVTHDTHGWIGVGHDLWLTRNGHGTGFWDRGYPQELADRLSKHAREMGDQHLWHHDGYIHIE
jgi:hypothetical protein